MATFIAKKLAQGESKSSVATKLGIHPSAVTHLLCLAGDAPPFVLELYHSGMCRSPQYLYRLTKLWRVDARLVENACAAAREVGLQLIETIESSMKKGGQARLSVVEPDALTVVPVSKGETSSIRPATAIQQPVQSTPGGTASLKPAPLIARDTRLRRPQLFGSLDGKDVEILIFIRPSSEGRVVVRYANELIESEVDLGGLALTRLADHS